MLKIDYFLVCEDVTFDENNKPSIINIVERLDTVKLPSALTGVKVVFRGHPEKQAIINKQTKFRVSSEINGKEVWNTEAIISVTVEKYNGFAQIIPVEPMMFPEYGLYTIKLSIDGNEAARTLFQVRDAAELSEP